MKMENTISKVEHSSREKGTIGRLLVDGGCSSMAAARRGRLLVDGSGHPSENSDFFFLLYLILYNFIH